MSEKKLIIRNSSGLCFEFLGNGSVRAIEVAPVRISLKPATWFSGSGTNIYLRKRGHPVQFKALLGPESDSRFHITENEFVASGQWNGLDYTCRLQLSPGSTCWQWKTEVVNLSTAAGEYDLMYIQDVGLKQISEGLVNEYYVSQYLERIILENDRYGAVLCCRQNMAEPTGHPWLLLACKSGATAGATDGMQVYGKSYRETGVPEGLVADKLGGDYAGESSVVALQERPFFLAPGEKHQSAFLGCALINHPEATSAKDLEQLPLHFGEFPDHAPLLPADRLPIAPKNLFNTASFLPAGNLDEQELEIYFGKERRHAEIRDGRLLSFFCREHDHVVLHEKERLVDRPHGHIMQAKSGFTPDEEIMSTTCFAHGVFNSHLTQGNTNFNSLLSVCTTQFNQSPASGQRIFVELDGCYYLLGVPSAFEMGLNHCRWIYKYDGHVFEVSTWTSVHAPLIHLRFRVLSGQKVKLLVTHDFDPLNGWHVLPETASHEFLVVPRVGSMIAGRFPDARFRIVVHPTGGQVRTCGDEVLFLPEGNHENSMFILEGSGMSEFRMSFAGETSSPVEIPEVNDDRWLSDTKDAHWFWQRLSLSLSLQGDHPDVAVIREILPWYGLNALIHFTTPYGLEQFGGAAWGTRDVSQGPVDLLLTMEKYEEARKVLCIVFSNQNPDGGWPQWWMFDSFNHIRAGDSHGDIYYWVLIALSQYILTTGDLSLPGEKVPYYSENAISGPDKTPISEHVDRLIRMIVNSFIPGTCLVPFGGGDWNDSLQPVSKELAGRMISSWTVEMNFQAFDQFRLVFEMTGEIERAEELRSICEGIKTDFNRYLVKDGVVAGYGLREIDGSIRVLLHPSDTTTGIHYSLLPMERGILSGIFTKEQAGGHLNLIEQHLKGPDGARLMDRPLKYKGGIQAFFQRAESSTFFGREIGLMYIHEHIRYAESQARTGRADAFVRALRQAIPVGYGEIVPCGDIRQSNCYYSSSDAIFRNRYEADELYDQILTGKITLRGGWRVYSSGPGIFVSLIVTRLLGLRIRYNQVIIDPVIPFSLDGLSASLFFLGYPVTFRYRVKESNYGPETIMVNGHALPLAREENPYRQGGAVISIRQFAEQMNDKDNLVEISL